MISPIAQRLSASDKSLPSVSKPRIIGQDRTTALESTFTALDASVLTIVPWSPVVHVGWISSCRFELSFRAAILCCR